MGDINVEYKHCSNSKWTILSQLFDLSELITEPMRVTNTSSTIIDHIQFVANHHTVQEDFVALHSLIMKHPDKHVPVKLWRVKCNRPPPPQWYTRDIGQTQIKRDKCKCQYRWSQYKSLRNKFSSLIRDAKRKHFTVSVQKQKYSKALCKYF